MSRMMLSFIVLVEGFITISTEILTMRQLLPLVGNSVIVTSIIIGFFLLFLAYGYRRGGQYQSHYEEVLKNNFTKSAVLLGVGLSYYFIWVFFDLLQHYFKQNLLLILSFYLFLITAPLVYFLGQTVPLTLNLLKREESIGSVGGKVLQLSTLGSFLGAIVTSLVLMNYLGVAWTVFINFALLFMLLLILFSSEHKDMLRIGILSFFLVVVYTLNIHFENSNFIATNTYANYRVLIDQNTQDKILMSNESMSALLTQAEQGYPYIELIRKILFKDLKLSGKKILALGAGGFTLTAESTFGNFLTYVDIDKDIKNIAKTYFTENTRGEFIAKDAREYLNTALEKFDVIVSDTYGNHRSIPSHLLTLEYFKLVKRKLNENGIAIFNVVARPTLEDAYSRRVDNTIRSVFNSCMTIPLKYTAEVGNILYVCRKEALPENDIYTDNLNSAALDYFKAIPNFWRMR